MQSLRSSSTTLPHKQIDDLPCPFGSPPGHARRHNLGFQTKHTRTRANWKHRNEATWATRMIAIPGSLRLALSGLEHPPPPRWLIWTVEVPDGIITSS